MADSKYYKIIFGFENGQMNACGGIEHEGKIWIVPTWLPHPDEGYAKPERMIPLNLFRFQKFDPPPTGPGEFAGADFAINDPLPKRLVHGEPTRQQMRKYGVLMNPDLKFRFGGTLH
jgi:hypothetical protein